MAKCKTVGIDNFIREMDVRANEFKQIAGKSLYAGADIIANQLRKNIEDLPERSPGMAKPGQTKKGVTKYQKAAMLGGMGIARMMNKDGTYDIKIGFDGYDDEVTEKYPKGHPISMIARAVESGTSFMEKTPFIRPAYNKAHAQAEQAMKSALEEAWADLNGKN